MILTKYGHEKKKKTFLFAVLRRQSKSVSSGPIYLNSERMLGR